MIALDTNILVYAHREDSLFHEVAARCVAGLAEGRAEWAIPWPCLHEFLAIVTHPRIYKPPTPLELALDQVAAWIETPALVLLGETAGYWEQLRSAVRGCNVSGPRVHDARVAALCLHRGIDELWTVDRDFSRFTELKVRNPLVS